MEYLDKLIEQWDPEKLRPLTLEEFSELKAEIKNFRGHGIPLSEIRSRREEERWHNEVKRLLSKLRDYNQGLRDIEGKAESPKSQESLQIPGDVVMQEGLALKPLSQRAQDVLVAMLQLDAVDADSLKSTTDIAHRAFGRLSDSNSIKPVIVALKEIELIQTKAGRGGGCWLLKDGRDRAEKLLKS